jgi:uncharacterized OB-fold protein
MSAPFTVALCAVCGHAAYPPRILCPVCASSDWTRRLADTGVVEEVTVRRPVTKHRQLPWGNWLDQEETRLGTVKTDLGPRIVCRVPEGVGPGDRVSLHAQASTAIATTGRDVEAAALPPGSIGRPGERGDLGELVESD